MTEQTASGASKAEKLVEVRLLRGYVPSNAVYDVPPEEPETRVYRKAQAGDVIAVPKAEAQSLVDNDIAKAVF